MVDFIDWAKAKIGASALFDSDKRNEELQQHREEGAQRNKDIKMFFDALDAVKKENIQNRQQSLMNQKNEAARWDKLGRKAFDATAERVGDWAYQTTKVPGAFQSYVGDPIGAGAASIANWTSNAKRKIDEKGFNQYLSDVVNRPEDYGELALAAAHDTGEWWASLFSGDGEKKEDPQMKNWLETYIASGGGSGLGGGTGGAGMPGESVPFPEIKYESPDWDAIYKRLDSIKAPEYREEAFNPQMVMANMLMNADLVNMDFSRAGRVMQDAFNRRAKNNADVWNARESDRAENEKWKIAKDIALQEMKAADAFKRAQVELANWEARQPKALGGNKMYWRDSSGNLHFQQIDKQGEARTVGTNAAMIEMLDLGDKISDMTPKQILQRANMAAMLYPDKDKIPFIQGYIMQATSMLPIKD